MPHSAKKIAAAKFYIKHPQYPQNVSSRAKSARGNRNTTRRPRAHSGRRRHSVGGSRKASRKHRG